MGWWTKVKPATQIKSICSGVGVLSRYPGVKHAFLCYWVKKNIFFFSSTKTCGNTKLVVDLLRHGVTSHTMCHTFVYAVTEYTAHVTCCVIPTDTKLSASCTRSYFFKKQNTRYHAPFCPHEFRILTKPNAAHRVDSDETAVFAGYRTDCSVIWCRIFHPRRDTLVSGRILVQFEDHDQLQRSKADVAPTLVLFACGKCSNKTPFVCVCSARFWYLWRSVSSILACSFGMRTRTMTEWLSRGARSAVHCYSEFPHDRFSTSVLNSSWILSFVLQDTPLAWVTALPFISSVAHMNLQNNSTPNSLSYFTKCLLCFPNPARNFPPLSPQGRLLRLSKVAVKRQNWPDQSSERASQSLIKEIRSNQDGEVWVFVWSSSRGVYRDEFWWRNALPDGKVGIYEFKISPMKYCFDILCPYVLATYSISSLHVNTFRFRIFPAI